MSSKEDRQWFSSVREFVSLVKAKMVRDIKEGVTHERTAPTLVPIWGL